jgi:hypothetical protein
VALTISRPVQIFALVAVIAAIGGGAMLMLKPKHAAAPPVVVTKPSIAPADPAKAAPGERTATTKAPATATTPARTTPAASASPPAPKASPVAADGLPVTIHSALKTHKIVVVSVFDPQSPTDAISYAEAKAGAAEANVGFVGISLLDNPVAAALTSALPTGDLLPAPGILIYRRPGTLVQRVDGFLDRDVVAQAAAASTTAAPLTASGS